MNRQAFLELTGHISGLWDSSQEFFWDRTFHFVGLKASGLDTDDLPAVMSAKGRRVMSGNSSHTNCSHSSEAGDEQEMAGRAGTRPPHKGSKMVGSGEQKTAQSPQLDARQKGHWFHRDRCKT